MSISAHGNIGAALGVHFAAGKNHKKTNVRRANHNAKVAIHLGKENLALRAEVGRLRGMVGGYRSAARAHGHHRHRHGHFGARRMAAFHRRFGAGAHAAMHRPYLGAAAALTNDRFSLKVAARAFGGHAKFSIQAQANALNFVAFRHAALLRF